MAKHQISFIFHNSLIFKFLFVIYIANFCYSILTKSGIK